MRHSIFFFRGRDQNRSFAPFTTAQITAGWEIAAKLLFFGEAVLLRPVESTCTNSK